MVPAFYRYRARPVVVSRGFELAPARRHSPLCAREFPVARCNPHKFQAITAIAAEIACPVITSPPGPDSNPTPPARCEDARVKVDLGLNAGIG